MNRRDFAVSGAVATAVAGAPVLQGEVSAMSAPIVIFEVKQININHSFTDHGTDSWRGVSFQGMRESKEEFPGSLSFYLTVDESEIENFPIGRKAYLVWEN